MILLAQSATERQPYLYILLLYVLILSLSLPPSSSLSTALIARPRGRRVEGAGGKWQKLCRHLPGTQLSCQKASEPEENYNLLSLAPTPVPLPWASLAKIASLIFNRNQISAPFRSVLFFFHSLTWPRGPTERESARDSVPKMAAGICRGVRLSVYGVGRAVK